MPFQVSTPERAAQLEKLRAYFDEVAEDEFRSWLRIEHDTGIKMDGVGRGLVRRILPLRASVHGEGVKKLGPQTAMGAVEQSFCRLRAAIKKTVVTTKKIEEKFGGVLPSDERARLRVLSGFAGAVAASMGAEPRRLKAPDGSPTSTGG